MPTRMNLAFDVSDIAMDGRRRMPGSWPGRTFPTMATPGDLRRIVDRLVPELRRRGRFRREHPAGRRTRRDTLLDVFDAP